jgi:hypothetical protein
MRTYTVARADGEVPLDGDAGSPWQRADRLDVDRFNWYDGGPKPRTTAWLLYDEDYLYARFDVADNDISSAVTELNGPTFQDSSVELFADPNPGADSRYFNFEANCCGVFKLAWQEEGWQERGIGRELISAELAEEIRVETSVEGPTREPLPDDEGWWLTAAIPFSVLCEFTGAAIEPEPETVWRANVYRSGVARDEMKATWNPMPTPEPDYHSPEYFGQFRFE